ncbi:WG repeat-containing protein [Paenibacillus sp. FSL P4-0081]|uniref:WG repeat-containing protein n=1 Tax=Paenibacillus sp. FSL P4-0081 TaxID=1536769 RepID=UPI000693C6FE|nr:WG repeat-containing protein [Paenibacillus sp. FSL P4-0081]
MYSHRSFIQNHRLAAVLAAGLFALAAFFGLGSAYAHADRWEVFDQGEHLFFPEGPIEIDGVVMVPLRPIAERFGYTFVSVSNKEIVLKNAEGHRAVVRLGTKTALLDYDGGSKTQLMAQIPRNYNGAWFIDLALAGAMGGQGHSTVPGTNLIQLRPVSGDAQEQLEQQYWFNFMDKGKTVFVNNQGQEQLRTSNTPVYDFGYEELLPVKTSAYTAGFMNRAGELVLDTPHYQVGQFYEGLAWFKDMVKTGSGGFSVKMGFMNRAGKIVIPAIYSRVYDFSDGLAKVAGGKTLYIDHSGKIVIPGVSGLQNSESFSNGLALVTVRTTSGGKSVIRTGFIDTKGNWAIKPIYDSASSFSEGVATAALNGKSGLLDTKGKLILKPEFSTGNGFVGQFHDGYIVLTLSGGEHDYKQRLVDANGNIIAIPGAEQINGYGDGMISYKDGGYGFKNVAGDVIVKPAFSEVRDFKAGAGKGFTNINNEQSACLINKAGEIVWSRE